MQHPSALGPTLSLSAEMTWVTWIVSLSVSSVGPVANNESLPAPRMRVRMPVNVADGIMGNVLALSASPILW